MTPQYLDALITTAYTLLPPEMDLPAARPLLLAIALQESRADARRQIVRYLPESRKPVYGVARGFWQFEQAGGTTGVLEHPASARAAAQVCAALGFEATPATVHAALDRNDILACAFARLLLWTSPKALPLRGARKTGGGST